MLKKCGRPIEQKEERKMNWDTTKVEKNEYYHMLSMMTIKNDCETILQLMLQYREPVIVLGLAPYYALFCKAIEEYYSANYDATLRIQNGSKFRIEDARATLKLFNERYGKTSNYVSALDKAQDEQFKRRLRYSFLKNINANYNLGIYFNGDKIPIGNTQYNSSLFQGKTPSSQELNKEELIEFGKSISTVVASVSKGLEAVFPYIQPKVIPHEVKIYYLDLNTDRHKLFSFEKEVPKAVSLLLLHVLCITNFVLFFVDNVLANNTWKFRVQYIAMYYAQHRIKQMEERETNEQLKRILSQCLSALHPVFSSEFRSCMMHYSFINKGDYLISDQYLDWRLPLFGLVESCFDGKKYESVQAEVRENLKMISETLMGLLAIEKTQLKEL